MKTYTRILYENDRIDIFDDIDFTLWLHEYWLERALFWRTEADKYFEPHPTIEGAKWLVSAYGRAAYSMAKHCEIRALTV